MAEFTLLYPGRQYEIWVQRKSGRCPILEFSRELMETQERVYKRLRGILESTADKGKYNNPEIYRSLGDGIFEFKAQMVRVFSFDDGRRIVLTHATKKRGDRAVGEKKLAFVVRDEYQRWKVGGSD